MAEPEGDNRGVDASVQQPHRGGVTQGVGADPFAAQGWAGSGSGRQVLGEAGVDGVAAGKERIGGLALCLAEPTPQRQNGIGGQGCGPLFAALAGAGDVGGPEVNVASGQRDQFRDAKTALVAP